MRASSFLPPSLALIRVMPISTSKTIIFSSVRGHSFPSVLVRGLDYLTLLSVRLYFTRPRFEGVRGIVGGTPRVGRGSHRGGALCIPIGFWEPTSIVAFPLPVQFSSTYGFVPFFLNGHSTRGFFAGISSPIPFSRFASSTSAYLSAFAYE